MADDLEAFLKQHFAKEEKRRIVLVGHSMGGMVMMHYLWTRRRTLSLSNRGTNQPEPNGYDRAGGIALDIGPGPRPASFSRMGEAVKNLQSIPLEKFHSRGELEDWVIANLAPKEIYRRDNIWVVRYLLTNVDTTVKPYVWRVPLPTVVKGLNSILWTHGDECSSSASFSSLETKVDIPMLFIFGEKSDYNALPMKDPIPRYFSNATVTEVAGGSHFLFLDKKAQVVQQMREFLTSKHFA